MAANNLVTSGYIAMLRQSAVEGTPVKPLRRRVSSMGMITNGSPRKADRVRALEHEQRGCSSASTTATAPFSHGAHTPGTNTPNGDPRTPVSVLGSPSVSEGSMGIPKNLGPLGSLEVSLDRFREIGINRRQAQSPQDVMLCWKMCTLMGLEADVPDLFVVMLYRSTKLLHRCGYHTQDIVTIASFAIVYAIDVLALHLGTMDWKEAANMFGLQLYLAHAYVMDEHCPLKEWHKHIFSQYCSLNVLSIATLQLMRSRSFMLCLPAQGLTHISRELMLAVHNYRWNPSILESSGPSGDDKIPDLEA